MDLSRVSVDRLFEVMSRDVRAIVPELILAGTIVLLLLLHLVRGLRRVHFGWFAFTAVAIAMVDCVLQWDVYTGDSQPLFTGLLVVDRYSIALRLIVLGATGLTLVTCLLSGIPDRSDAADFATMLLGGSLGMLLMVGVNHLLMVFLAIEMASLPSYALAGFLKGRKRGSEAALKYVVYGAAASGVLLYGISLLAGGLGTGSLPVLANDIRDHIEEPAIVLGLVLSLCGLGFKLAVVPFHFWCPDVFEGAAAEVAGYLSTASKAAAFGLTMRLVTLFAPLPHSSTLVLAGVAIVTTTFGNLAAFGQTNLKRLLAYSTIAHAGLMLAAVSVATPSAGGSLLFYLAIYMLMNLGAFAVVAFVRNATGSEDLADYRGLIERQPALAVALSVCLLSLLGMPPLAGFAAKFQIFQDVYRAGRDASDATLARTFYTLLVVIVLNTAISAAYYLRVIRVMVFDAPPSEATPRKLRAGTVFAMLLAVSLLVVGIQWDWLTGVCRESAECLRRVVSE